mgnify:CR=1 FL=1
MPNCDYCGATFGGEDAYLDHLAAEHEGELGSIDRRRVDEHEGDDGGCFPVGPAILVGLLALAGGLVVYVTFLMGGSGGTAAASGLPDRGADSVISQVQTEEAAGRGVHETQGTEIDYERVPPTSGTHWGGTWESAGFYTEQQPLESLVHSLEHGAVVVYYDPAQLNSEAEESLRGWASNQTGNWRNFIAVPNPNENPDSAYVLTAWEKRLAMDEYDDATVRAFTAEYLGRGPENPVR